MNDESGETSTRLRDNISTTIFYRFERFVSAANLTFGEQTGGRWPRQK
jgi:hypothetical protein